MTSDNEITVQEAARILRVHPSQVCWYYRKGYLPARRIGERVLVFNRADVERFEKPRKTGRPKALKGRNNGN